jgi:hypothetical protein
VPDGAGTGQGGRASRGGDGNAPPPGVSMRHSFDNADAPTREQVQYYETVGTRGTCAGGWKAVTEHGPSLPRARSTSTMTAGSCGRSVVGDEASELAGAGIAGEVVGRRDRDVDAGDAGGGE